MTSQKQDRGNSLRLNQIINAIPKEINEEPPVQDPLGNLMAKIGNRQVPVRKLNRIWLLGSMQARIAVGYLAYTIRSNFVSDTEKERLHSETKLKAAIELIGTMGYLRGAVLKIGQMLGNIPHILPDEITDTLDSLHFEAPPMHYSLIREVFLNELGKDPEGIFTFFDKKAFAAASFGQVHRATLTTGEQVAVKIQYPNMAATIRADLGALHATLKPIKLKKKWAYGLTHLKDTEQMLLSETDYRKEARFMEKVRNLFDVDDQIVVPRLWGEFSTDRVLTMEYIPGLHLRDFLATNPDQESRDRYGELISIALIRVWGQLKTIYTDPNPGNFIFMSDGRLGFIDFGSYRKLSPDEWQDNIDSDNAALSYDIEALDKSIAKICFCSVDEMDPNSLKLLRDIALWLAEPAMEDRVFNFGDQDFYKQGIDIFTRSVRNPYTSYNSLYNWYDRLVVYHRTVLYRLKSRINYRQIYDREKNYKQLNPEC